ncbi:putative phage-related protein [Vibrio coralliirubri]|uniref:hypothetical protein n=1 Tax=Vibrio coralliirubri TaxID=1516159 RepID=UPI00062F452D|nr:hypothetical protein [Vibrio coralliirubri]CDT71247.1 putative phage-related protein [Vibrio coralliirubri]
MKKLPLPRIDDVVITRTIANNPRLNETTFPHLRNQLGDIERAYELYVQELGNAWNIEQPNLTAKLGAGLKSNYSSPPVDLNFLERIRKSSPEVCPMCGSANPTTLDHLFPKESYPAWAIFSKNLVPACSCNTYRGIALKGNEASQARVLHPYFDDCLNERVLTTVFEFPDNFRWVKAKVDYVDLDHPNIASIRFHVRNIVLKNKIDVWLRGQMTKLKEFPPNVIKGLSRRRLINEGELVDTLEDLLDSYDEQCGTPNNWNSILIHGLLNKQEVHGWIIERHREGLANR